MSIGYDSSEQRLPSSKATDVHHGNEKYDPFAVDDDDDNRNHLSDHTTSKSANSNKISSEEVQPGIDNRNHHGYLSSTVPGSGHSNDQEEPYQEHRSRAKYSERRSRSPHHRSYFSSDRKRSRTSPSDSFDKSRRASHHDNEKYTKRKSYSRHRSFSRSPSPPNTKKLDSKESKSINGSENHIEHSSSKRDDHQSARISHHSSFKPANRDYSSSMNPTSHDRRSRNAMNLGSSPSRIPSNSSDDRHQVVKVQETTTEDRNRIFNRLKTVNDTNVPGPVSSSNHSKASSTNSVNYHSNGSSQRSRSNLIQIVTTEASSVNNQTTRTTLASIITKPEPAKETKKTEIKHETPAKINGVKAGEVLMEEMLLEEEKEQVAVKPIDLDSLMIPESSTKKPEKQDETSAKVIPVSTSTVTTTTTVPTVASIPSLTPSPTKKPYTLYKVPNTNHTTPPLALRYRKSTKTDSSNPQSDSPSAVKSNVDDSSRRTSLDDRISNLLSASNEQNSDTRSNPSQPLPTQSDKNKQEHSSSTKKSHHNDERRSTSSKHYTSEWLASQKPEEAAAPIDELPVFPPLISLPTLTTAPATTKNVEKVEAKNTGTTMIDKLSEVMSKFIQKQADTNTTATNDPEEVVPTSAKHLEQLERLERRKLREKRQTEIATIAKEALKPAFRKHIINKEEYKEIMKKVVTKATHANEINRGRIRKMIEAYLKNYRVLHEQQQKSGQISTTSNGNSH